MPHALRKLSVAFVAFVLACGMAVLVGCDNTGTSSTNTNTTTNTNGNASKNSNTNSTENANASNENTTANSSSNIVKLSNSEMDYIKKVDSDDPYASGIHHATVTVEGYDPFVIELDANRAPITVSNFCKLANDGFYNGHTFYRFQEDFCMQGGSSNDSAEHAVDDDGLSRIKGEFSENGVKNRLADTFKKGTVAMARSSDMNSADSTFFVTLASTASVKSALNGKYAAFGTIDDDGMKIVDEIVEDHLEAASEDSSGMGNISDPSKHAKITSIKITD